MKKILSILLITMMVFMLSACKTSDSDTTDSTSIESPIQKTQYLNHDETQVYEWKCDIAPTKIKVYTGSPLEGFFITTDDELYEYNSETIFSETQKSYRKIDTDFKFIYIHYNFQSDKFSLLTDTFKTYSYNKEEKSFVNMDNDFGSVIKEFDGRGKILSWSIANDTAVIWFMDKKGDIYDIKQTKGSEYTKSLVCNMSTNEKIISSALGIIKTENEYYCFDSKKSCFILSEEPTAAYDNIAFLNDFIIMYKDDPNHIYDHKLIYKSKFSYY